MWKITRSKTLFTHFHEEFGNLTSPDRKKEIVLNQNPHTLNLNTDGKHSMLQYHTHKNPKTNEKNLNPRKSYLKGKGIGEFRTLVSKPLEKTHRLVK